MKISRRELASLAVAGAAAAQTQERPPAAADELEQARRQLARNSEALLKHEISMAAEPAFQFKA
ncbi:MAG TPA: hypothetical protein VL285_23425 [Bryobacteraceae bacterium]|jgi:hypothetical protein|nr:hypothetical protein [Bryobacteraceae bacterium]